MKAAGAVVLHGGHYDQWDLEARGGFFGSSRLLMAVEDTGSGTQLVRVRAWPRCSRALVVLLSVLAALVVFAVLGTSYFVTGTLCLLTTLLVNRTLRECGVTMRTIEKAMAACGLVAEKTSRGIRAEVLSRLPKRAVPTISAIARNDAAGPPLEAGPGTPHMMSTAAQRDVARAPTSRVSAEN
jgi:hypothetical protein